MMAVRHLCAVLLVQFATLGAAAGPATDGIVHSAAVSFRVERVAAGLKIPRAWP